MARWPRDVVDNPLWRAVADDMDLINQRRDFALDDDRLRNVPQAQLQCCDVDDHYSVSTTVLPVRDLRKQLSLIHI